MPAVSIPFPVAVFENDRRPIVTVTTTLRVKVVHVAVVYQPATPIVALSGAAYDSPFVRLL